MFYVGEPGHLWWWAGALPLVLWVIAPAIAPYLIAARKSRRWFSIAMFLFLIASTIFSGVIYCDALLLSSSSTAALVMVFIPLYQWMALAFLLLICLGVTAWLARHGNAPS
jgi:uncharacterized membrane protein YgdD (TMEM256/DUF423 family)